MHNVLIMRAKEIPVQQIIEYERAVLVMHVLTLGLHQIARSLLQIVFSLVCISVKTTHYSARNLRHGISYHNAIELHSQACGAGVLPATSLSNQHARSHYHHMMMSRTR
jgi:hypothetical protein